MTTPLVYHTPVIGIAGWKNSGKTTMTVRLIEELARRGFRIATLKHAHHAFEIDTGTTDSARHRRAGAGQVAIVSRARWALVKELGEEAEPRLEAILARLDPCDLILVEGYKRAPILKLEVRRAGAAQVEPLSAGDPLVIAIAADYPIADSDRPVFHLDAIPEIASFIAERCGLRPSSAAGPSE
jgi:molybdopterin-guanine dinucleotide biosynthesis protein B